VVRATLDQPCQRVAEPAHTLAERCTRVAGHASVAKVEPTDALLGARLAAGDDHALAEVFDSMAAAVFGTARRVLGDSAAAEDVVQDVFVELWTRPERFDPGAGSLRTYLTVLARHRAVDLLRSELRRLARQERHHRLSPGPRQESPGESVAAAETSGMVREALRSLPDGQRQVVELAYFRGLSNREVAVAAGIPEGTAKSRLRLALAKLEAVLDRELLEPS
jgi:RNA polymerase sigma-70 factor, ECF subfamily